MSASPSDSTGKQDTGGSTGAESSPSNNEQNSSQGQSAESGNISKYYATKKSVTEGMLDVALLMTNASQLKAVLEHGPAFKYYIPLIVFIALSLLFQVLVGVLFILMAHKELNYAVNRMKLEKMNNVATVLVFITVVINIFITAFGVQKTGLHLKQ